MSVRVRSALRAVFFLALSLLPPSGARAETILDTKHNLSVTGPGTVKALSETRVCVFCHTPHNASPGTPLWNREVGSQTYLLYANAATLNAAPGQPLGPSRLCLSCHDGLVALGAVLRPVGGIVVAGGIAPGSPALIGAGADLSKDHPFSFPYLAAAAADPGIRGALPADLLFYNGSSLECPTCHDAHKDVYRSPDRGGTPTGKFLTVSNRYSGLCVTCHDVVGWVGSAHQQAADPVDGAVFPVAPRRWPTWPTVAEWGCGICHAPHAAQSGPLLLYYPTEAETCAPCHGGPFPGDPHADALAGARASDVGEQTEKPSAHRMTASRARPADARGAAVAVTCADCHNTHVLTGGAAAANANAGVRPGASIAGALRGVSGVDRAGEPVKAAAHEYEICFKCHADGTARRSYGSRVVPTADTRLQFDPANPSFHPVLGSGRSNSVPSLPSRQEPALTPASLISCTDCHRDDDGVSRGPHGSAFAPILRERYDTEDHTRESEQSYALCYRCHERASILADASFRRRFAAAPAGGGGHSGHLAAGAPCAACHDAHGVPEAPGTGDHTHLINFDESIVTALPGESSPRYESRGGFTGACTLVCHGRAHRGESYP